VTGADVVAEILPQVEPITGLRDDSLARPPVYVPDTTYGWPVRDAYQIAGDGSMDRLDFRVAIAWAAPADDEIAAVTRTRAVSDQIRARVEALREWVRDHRSGSSYDQLHVSEVNYLDLVTNSARGFVATVSGWKEAA
jgi:hypothetical protein